MARQRTTTPTKPDDARVQRSIDALHSGLLELIPKRRFDQITIKEITDAAGLSYPTFFRRFASKEELLEDIAASEVRKLLKLGEQAMSRAGGPQGSSTALILYVQDHRTLWRTLLTGGAASAMRQEFMRVAKEIADSRPRTNPWLPLELAVPFVSSGIFEILAWWMKQPDNYPVENVIKLFDALVIDAAGRPRDIKLA